MVLVPRGGSPQVNKVKGLAASGTGDCLAQSQGFSAEVSHLPQREIAAPAGDRNGDRSKDNHSPSTYHAAAILRNDDGHEIGLSVFRTFAEACAFLRSGGAR